MKAFKNNCIKALVFVLFFGFCIFMAGGVDSKAADDPKLALESCDVAVGSTYKLNVYNLDGRTVIYRSSDSSIVTVSNKGRLKGRNCGDAVITAIIMDNGSVISTQQCDVHVGPAAVSIRFTSKRLVLCEGTAKKIYPLVIPKNTVENPYYGSDDKTIATISYSGTVRAKGIGTTNVSGYLLNGESDTCQVIVLSYEDYEDYKLGKRSLEDLLSDNTDTDAQDDKTESGDDVTTVPDKGVVTPTPTPTAAPATAPVAAPVAGK